MSAYMTALFPPPPSSQGGSRTGGPGFHEYLALEAQHFPVLLNEFVYNGKRAVASMLRYRGKRRPWDGFASRLLCSLCEVGGWVSL